MSTLKIPILLPDSRSKKEGDREVGSHGKDWKYWKSVQIYPNHVLWSWNFPNLLLVQQSYRDPRISFQWPTSHLYMSFPHIPYLAWLITLTFHSELGAIINHSLITNVWFAKSHKFYMPSKSQLPSISTLRVLTVIISHQLPKWSSCLYSHHLSKNPTHSACYIYTNFISSCPFSVKNILIDPYQLWESTNTS